MDRSSYSDQEKIRRTKLAKLIKENNNPFLISAFKRSHTSKSFELAFGSFDREQLERLKLPSAITTAGRIKNRRLMGSSCFIIIQDGDGVLQIFLRKQDLTLKDFEALSALDLGDIVGFTGLPIRTKTGHLTLKAQKFTLLTKSLKVLPDKHHGLKNIEDQYRKRYLDLIVNPDSKQTFINRFKIIRSIQKFLDDKGYLEVETPVLQNIQGGAAAKPFTTYHNALKKPLFLRVATELHLKRLVVGGFEKVYEIGRLFRNEGIDTSHNPEFTSIEIYTAYDGMEATMQLCEDILRNCAQVVLGKTVFVSNEVKIKFNQKFARIHMVDAVKLYTKIDFWQPMTFSKAKELALKHKLEVPNHFNTVGHIINLFFEEYVEQNLIQPTFVYGYPVAVSPLAKRNMQNPNFTDRFELFIMGSEYANAFAELNNPLEQYERFQEQLEEQQKGNEEAPGKIDYDYIEALEYGLPPTGGIGIGIDRLVMLLSNKQAIRNVVLFPMLKNK